MQYKCNSNTSAVSRHGVCNSNISAVPRHVVCSCGPLLPAHHWDVLTAALHRAGRVSYTVSLRLQGHLPSTQN